MPQLEGQITSFADVQAQPNYQKLPSDIQAQIALDYFEKRVATQPNFQSAPPEAQEAMRQDFRTQYKVPSAQPVTSLPGRQSQPSPVPVYGDLSKIPVPNTGSNFAWNGGAPNGMLSPATPDALKGYTAGQQAAANRTLKGATFGYGDLSGIFPQLKPNNATEQQLGDAYELGASLIPIELAAQGTNWALKGLGRYLLPKTTQYARAAGQSIPFARELMKGASWLQGRGLAPQAARSGLDFAAYEGLKRREGVPILSPQQFDPMGRLQSAAGGFGLGAAFPPAIAGAGKVLKGGIKATRQVGENVSNLFRPDKRSLNPIAQKAKQDTLNALKYLDGVLTKLRSGEIDKALVTADDYASLVTTMENLSKTLKQGRTGKNLQDALQAGARIERKAKIRAKYKNRPVESEEYVQKTKAKQQNGAEPKPTENQQPHQQKSSTPEQSQGQGREAVESHKIQLQGSITQMVEQGLKEAGLTLDEAKTLIGEVNALGKSADDPRIIKLKEERKALGNKRDDATRDAKAKIDAEIQKVKDERSDLRNKAAGIHPNLREVLNTGWDGKSAVADQLPVSESQLTFDQVSHLLEGKVKATGEVLNTAMEKGVSVRLEHQAEITGSTDAAAKITSAGNVKVPVSTFTPTHFGKVTKEGKEYVFAEGYNEAGHLSKYYVTPSPEGSQILKVHKVLGTEAHVGTVPNVVLGPRKFKVADVLGKAPRQEGTLTSEALAAAKGFKELFKPENFNKFSKPVQNELKIFQKQGKFDERSFERMYNKLKQNKEDLKVFCNVAGLI